MDDKSISNYSEIRYKEIEQELKIYLKKINITNYILIPGTWEFS